jgi:hypothetical protein
MVRQDQLATQGPAGYLTGLLWTVLLPLRDLIKVEEALRLLPNVVVKSTAYLLFGPGFTNPNLTPNYK